MPDQPGSYDFIYVHTDIPEGMTIHEWHEQRAAERAAQRELERAARRRAHTGAADRAGARVRTRPGHRSGLCCEHVSTGAPKPCCGSPSVAADTLVPPCRRLT
jgi:hypothetical protein